MIDDGPQTIVHGPSSMVSFQHWHFDAMTFRGFDGNIITCIRVSHYAHAWVGGEDAFQSRCGFRCSIGNDDLTRMLRISHADSAAMMEGYPSGATYRVDHGIEDRPIRDRV